MKFKVDRERGRIVFYLRSNSYKELAWATLGIHGLQAEIEFPSDWHEEKRGWIRLGLGFGSLNVSFPWSKVVPDEGQCSGPRYGFQFYEDLMWIRWGKDTGRFKTDPHKAIYMPWAWKHRKHEVLTDEETYPYTYTLRSGEVQSRTATIKHERRLWTRWWLPFRRVSNAINVTFNDEVGERSGSWKGGCIGCGYEMQRGETPVQTLRHMERERKF
ncbi:hypothetical protein [Hydrogenophaga sp.]|uniref:hypothetical protein n=1 Tax=Hydrogenophaga sp. TaxID=1904254 RepID=UPI003F73039E